MVDSADLGFYGAAWRFTDFCQHLYARSVYLQLVLKSCELPGLSEAAARIEMVMPAVEGFSVGRWLCSPRTISLPAVAGFSGNKSRSRRCNVTLVLRSLRPPR
jgi:hypothetical protein